MKLIQGSAPEENNITDNDIISANIARSDEGVANFFWVGNNSIPLVSNEDQKAWTATEALSTFALFDYINTQTAFYGFRKMEVTSMLVGPEYLNSDNPTMDQLPEQNGQLFDWLGKRRKLLADINKDNVIFESGAMQIRGNERIKAGTYLRVTRANGVATRYYVTKVDHSFTPFQGMVTAVTLARGRSFIERAKAATPQYLPEIDAKGVR